MTEWRRGDYLISTDLQLLDVPLIHRFLSTDAYWSLGRTEAAVRRSIDNSAVCFGLYAGGRQIGFARLVSDLATFAWLCDVFVLPEARGLGLGKWLVGLVVETAREAGLTRVLLATRDAHALYAGHGFQPLAEPDRWMILFPGQS